MGCATSSQEHYRFEIPSFEGDQWLQRHRYRLFWKALDPKISQSEVALLHAAWSASTAGYNMDVGQRLFFTIFERCPEIRDEVFGWRGLTNEQIKQNKRFIHHCLIFQDTVAMIINELAATKEELSAKIVTFGSQHAFYTRRQFSSHYWAVFGQAMIDLGVTIALPRAHRYKATKLANAWRKMVRFIVSSMQLGYAVGQHTDLPSKRALKKAIADNELMYLLSRSASHLDRSPSRSPRPSAMIAQSRESIYYRPSMVSFSIEEPSSESLGESKSVSLEESPNVRDKTYRRCSFRSQPSHSFDETSTSKQNINFLTVRK